MLEEIWLRRRKMLAIAIPVVAAVLVVAGFITWFIWQKDTTQASRALPTSVTSQIKDFKPYFYKQALPHNYALNPSSVSYEKTEGVLFATLKNDKGNTIAFTQQSLPDKLANQSREQFQKVGGADGEAYITFQNSKMVGGLFSNPQDGKRTLTLLVANDPIEETVMADLLRGLRPVK